MRRVRAAPPQLSFRRRVICAAACVSSVGALPLHEISTGKLCNGWAGRLHYECIIAVLGNILGLFYFPSSRGTLVASARLDLLSECNKNKPWPSAKAGGLTSSRTRGVVSIIGIHSHCLNHSVYDTSLWTRRCLKIDRHPGVEMPAIGMAGHKMPRPRQSLGRPSFDQCLVQ